MNSLITLIVVILLLSGNKFNYFNIEIFGYLDELIVVLCLIYAMTQLFKRKRINQDTLKKFLFLLLFIIIGIMGCVINSNYTIDSLIMGTFLAIKFWLLVFAIEYIPYKEERYNSIVRGIFIVEKIAIFFALFNLLMPNLYFEYFTFKENYLRIGINSVTSVFNHPSTFGWFMLMCGIIRFSKYRFDNKKTELVYSIIDLIFAVLSLRTKVLITIIILILFYTLFINNERIKNQMRSIIITGIISVLILLLFGNVIQNTISIYYKGEQGITARSVLQENSIKIAKEYFPLGVGFGKYGTYYASVYYSEYYLKYGMNRVYGMENNNAKYSTDTFWPAILGETGFFGLLIFSYLIMFTFIKLYKGLKNIEKKGNQNQKIVLLSSVLLMLQIMVESLGEASFNTSPKNIIVGLFVGMSLSIINNKGELTNDK